MELERGKLYQVYYCKNWIIAEYLSRLEAHTAHGLRHTGEREWHEPASHYWKHANTGGGTFPIYEKGMQVREITEETLTEIQRLRSEIAEADKALRAKWRELRDLCR